MRFRGWGNTPPNRISDNYARFYLKYILPYAKMIDEGAYRFVGACRGVGEMIAIGEGALRARNTNSTYFLHIFPRLTCADKKDIISIYLMANK